MEPKKAVKFESKDFLLSSSLEEFENKSFLHFYKHSSRILYMDASYTDWITNFLCKSSWKQNEFNSLVINYLQSNNIIFEIDKKFFLKLLQLLSFLRLFKGYKEKESIGS